MSLFVRDENGVARVNANGGGLMPSSYKYCCCRDCCTVLGLTGVTLTASDFVRCADGTNGGTLYQIRTGDINGEYDLPSCRSSDPLELNAPCSFIKSVCGVATHTQIVPNNSNDPNQGSHALYNDVLVWQVYVNCIPPPDESSGGTDWGSDGPPEYYRIQVVAWMIGFKAGCCNAYHGGDGCPCPEEKPERIFLPGGGSVPVGVGGGALAYVFLNHIDIAGPPPATVTLGPGTAFACAATSLPGGNVPGWPEFGTGSITLNFKYEGEDIVDDEFECTGCPQGSGDTSDTSGTDETTGTDETVGTGGTAGTEGTDPGTDGGTDGTSGTDDGTVPLLDHCPTDCGDCPAVGGFILTGASSLPPIALPTAAHAGFCTFFSSSNNVATVTISCVEDGGHFYWEYTITDIHDPNDPRFILFGLYYVFRSGVQYGCPGCPQIYTFYDGSDSATLEQGCVDPGTG